MLIRCKLPEVDNVEFFGHTKYHFKKDAAGVMLCDVQDEDAARHFLSKPDIYEAVDESAIEALRAAVEDDEDDDGVFEEVVAPPPGVDPLANATLEELQALYKERFGKAAHPNAKHETLLAKLREE